MKTILWQKSSAQQKLQSLARPLASDTRTVAANVLTITEAVKDRGDQALYDFSLKFDGVACKDFYVSAEETKEAASSLSPSLRAAIKLAKKNIYKFHKAQYPKTIKVHTMPGVTCQLQWRPIESIGLYIPAGTAPLFSTILMQAIPALIAGCKNIILCSPPQKNGRVHQDILATAYLCGIKKVFAIGGAQAIAAMAYGTKTVPKVDKIFGPGNAYVTAAKQIISQDPSGAAIDMPAGPSEVMVIAEKTARVDWVAADLLAQAEHDTSSQAILITTSMTFGKHVQREITKQLAQLSRKTIAAQSIANSRIIVVPEMTIAIRVANLYAPEHLIIHSKDAAAYLDQITHAGSVFIGEWTPEAVGDYASGTNHVLPTNGYARFYSGLSVLNFMKSMTVQTLTRQGIQKLGSTVVTMAQAEGLDAHANAVTLRLRSKR